MESNFPIVFALYSNITLLDFAGPLEVFSRLPGATCLLASVDGGMVQAEGGVSFIAERRLRDVSDCALLCVPGGFGVTAAMADRAYLSELRRLAAAARYVTSVCTGSLLLAAAGLLEGKRAACHWAWRHLFDPFGVTFDPARVVRDGNVITGSGITAGIDMALIVMAEAAGPSYAQAVQLALEYAPLTSVTSGGSEHALAEIGVAVKH